MATKYISSRTAWILAVVLTISSAYYQRVSGPTYPLKGSINAGGSVINYKLERSHSTSSDYHLIVEGVPQQFDGIVLHKRYKSFDEWQEQPMKKEGGCLTAVLPKQPSAGKLMYMVELWHGAEKINLTKMPVVMRFKGDVPAFILIPHILCMFLMMLFGVRAGLELFRQSPNYLRYTFITVIFTIIGGLILGPVTQKYAFGEYWTGIPFGYDLTDNKTLIAFIFWVIAMTGVLITHRPRFFVATASLVTFIIFLIPHSVLGSEIDYTKQNKPAPVKIERQK